MDKDLTKAAQLILGYFQRMEERQMQIEQRLKRLEQYVDRANEVSTKRKYRKKHPGLTPQRRAILNLIRAQPGLRPKAIAAALNRPESSIRRLLHGLTLDKQVESREGAYYLHTTAGLSEVEGDPSLPGS